MEDKNIQNGLYLHFTLDIDDDMIRERKESDERHQIFKDKKEAVKQYLISENLI